jgi:hypothetical protein
MQGRKFQKILDQKYPDAGTSLRDIYAEQQSLEKALGLVSKPLEPKQQQILEKLVSNITNKYPNLNTPTMIKELTDALKLAPKSEWGKMAKNVDPYYKPEMNIPIPKNIPKPKYQFLAPDELKAKIAAQLEKEKNHAIVVAKFKEKAELKAGVLKNGEILEMEFLSQVLLRIQKNLDMKPVDVLLPHRFFTHEKISMKIIELKDKAKELGIEHGQLAKKKELVNYTIKQETDKVDEI